MNEHVEATIRDRERQVKGRFGTRVWICEGCKGVLGVFSEDFDAVDIQSQRVNLTVSGGSIERTCHRCMTVNILNTRQKHEDVESWKKRNVNKLAHRNGALVSRGQS